MKIMVIDDDAAINRSLKKAIVSAGHQCYDFLDPEEAIEEFKKSYFDIVLSDMKMPGKSGLEVLQDIRNRSPLTPVIIMTGYADEDSIIKALNMGAIKFYRKPINLRKLISFFSKIEAEGLKQKLIQLPGNSLSDVSKKIIDDYKKMSGMIDD